MPAAGERRRIALIYATGSPNVDYRTPVVLIEAVDGRWAVDEDAFERFDGTDPALSVAKVGQRLAMP